MAFLLSAPPREPFLHAPASVLWLIGVLVAVYLLSVYGPLPDSFWDRAVFVPERLAEGFSLAGAWPLAGHMFLHAGALHLIMNCLALLAFGPPVARRYGGGWFLALFLLSGVAGALTHLAFHWGASEGVVGASGGISGLMGAALRLIRWPGQANSGRPIPVFSRPILSASLALVVLNAIVGWTGFEGQVVAWQAHIGGYVFGLIAVEAIDRLRFPRLYSAG